MMIKKLLIFNYESPVYYGHDLTLLDIREATMYHYIVTTCKAEDPPIEVSETDMKVVVYDANEISTRQLIYLIQLVDDHEIIEKDLVSIYGYHFKIMHGFPADINKVPNQYHKILNLIQYDNSMKNMLEKRRKKIKIPFLNTRSHTIMHSNSELSLEHFREIADEIVDDNIDDLSPLNTIKSKKSSTKSSSSKISSSSKLNKDQPISSNTLRRSNRLRFQAEIRSTGFDSECLLTKKEAIAYFIVIGLGLLLEKILLSVLSAQVY